MRARTSVTRIYQRRTAIAVAALSVVLAACAATSTPSATVPPTPLPSALRPSSSPVAPSASASAPGPAYTLGLDGIVLAQSSAARVPVALDAAQVEASAIDAFGLEVFRQVAKGDENVVISPTSLALALDMARAGARGATATQMDAVLHQDGPQSRWTDPIGSLDQMLAGLTQTNDNPKGPVGPILVRLQVENAPFVQAGFAIDPTYLDTLAARFGTGLRLVDYARDPEAARALINAWVAAQTDGRIGQLLGSGSVTNATRLTLVNTMELTAPWAAQFNPKATKPGPFTRPDGSVVQVPMMALADHQRTLAYAQGSGWQAVSLPYSGSSLTMTIVLPDDLAGFKAHLTAATLAQITNARRPRAVTITLPRFAIDTRADLAATLRSLGMSLAFDPTRADFSGITTQVRLSISAVTQQATITVDEKGTAATAATAVMMGLTGVARPLVPVTVHVDRPFLFILQDQATGAILFLGQVTDPSRRD